MLSFTQFQHAFGILKSLNCCTVVVAVLVNFGEYYEERVGLLQAVSPSTLNIEVGHGGYLACGHLDPAGFAKITVEP